MLAVFDVVKRVFWNDAVCDRTKWPTEEQLTRSQVHLGDLAAMTGKERVRVFSECGVHPEHIPIFLRALQHMTALHGVGGIEDKYRIHRHLSAHQWSPLSGAAPLLGHPIVNSEEFSAGGQNATKAVTGSGGHAAPGPSARENGAAEPSTFAMARHTSQARHTGLLNQGATCYLNSLLQSLYHLTAFRMMIFTMPTLEEAKEYSDPDVTEAKSIPYALQRLFCQLQMGKGPVGTTELTSSFGWSSSDSFIQHDVHELTRILLDNLEEKLNVANSVKMCSSPTSPTHNSASMDVQLLWGDEPAAQAAPLSPSPPCQENQPRKNRIHELFVGHMENYVRVDEVGYYGSREEPFYDLQLVVKNTRDIYESFDRLMQAEVLDGKNKYCLERDGTKTYYRAEKGVRLKSTPPIMLLHLTRFDFDLERGEMVKVLSRFDYYSTLDLSRYMPWAPKEETHYTLYSVMVHAGSNAGFGHYFCYVRGRDSWYQFNDEQVSPASLKEVFGANFGGTRTNLWGSEVPLTTSAYMLIYVRTSSVEELLRPVSMSEMPPHVVEQLRMEEVEAERRCREKEEDYLYGRVHFIQPKDIASNTEFLYSRRPLGHKFSSHRTLRVMLNKVALPELQEFAAATFGIDRADQLLWYASPQQTDRISERLHALVTDDLHISELFGDSAVKECCVLVMSKKSPCFLQLSPEAIPADEVTADGLGVRPETAFILCHHKFYDPIQLRVSFLGCTAIETVVRPRYACPISQVQETVRDLVALLADDSKKYHGHHLITKKVAQTTPHGKGTQAATQSEEATALAFVSTISSVTEGDSSVAALRSPTISAGTLWAPLTSTGSRQNDGAVESFRQRPSGHLTTVRETVLGGYVACDKSADILSGDVLVWQEEIRPEQQDDVFYPEISSFQHFLQSRIPVEIRLNEPPNFPTLISTELAEDFTYEQLQRYVARLIGKSEHYDRVRFTRYNPETRKPYFMKGRRRDLSTLARLLTPATTASTQYSKYVYYEYCKFSVPDIEAAHSLQFKYYDERVKPVSSHWVLLSRVVPLNIKNLFTTCAKEINASILELKQRTNQQEGRSEAAGVADRDTVSCRAGRAATDDVDGGATFHAPATDVEGASAHLESAPSSEPTSSGYSSTAVPKGQGSADGELLPVEDAWKILRLVDVWAGRIYNVFDRDNPIILEKDTFEESAEYRVERIPLPKPEMPLSQQVLLPVHHFAMSRNRNSPVETHGNPFSMYVVVDELPLDLLRRIAAKLGVSYQSVMDWKLALVKETRVVQLHLDVPVVQQQREFCAEEHFHPNQRQPQKMAFLGLEHAPPKSNLCRDEGYGVRIYN